MADRPQMELATSSAREAYPLAEQAAREWRRDAELRSVRATWHNPNPAELREGKTAWAFYFVSPPGRGLTQPEGWVPRRGGKLMGYIVTVSEGKAQGIREGEFPSDGQSLTFVDWKVDSPQALRFFLENGGQDFLAGHAQADAHAILQGAEGGQPPTWELTLLDKQTKTALSLQLDASTGKVRRRS
ncbi:MAG: hypothetical protein HYX94_10655 [Chloroflexi bacterium]|nr:hypothetical protein [Chloroflexota bacterium]